LQWQFPCQSARHSSRHNRRRNPGKWADTIAVEMNPLDDAKVIQDAKFLMKSGVVYKNETK
jgi:hypothetical protein